MSNDLISRQAAIDAVHEDLDGCRNWNASGTETANEVEMVLDCLPSAQTWIPVTERLPDRLVAVNITWVNHNPPSYYEDVKDEPFVSTAYYHKGKWWWYSCVCGEMLAEYGQSDFDEIDKDIEVIAWMPFPEPYEE